MNKNDPNDGRSVAVAALRSPDVRAVTAEDHASVMKLWVRRHRDLSRTRNRIVCRLHAVLCDLVPDGFAQQLSAVQAAAVLGGIDAVDAIGEARPELAHELLEAVSMSSAERPSDAWSRSSLRPVPPSRTSTAPAQSIGDVGHSDPELAVLGLAHPFRQVIEYRDSGLRQGILDKPGTGERAVRDHELGVRLDETTIVGPEEPHLVGRGSQRGARISNEPDRIARPEHYDSIHHRHPPSPSALTATVDDQAHLLAAPGIRLICAAT